MKKRGYELPFSFGISFSFFFGLRDIKVKSVDMEIKKTTLDGDDYALIKVHSKERNWSLRLDAWILPFLNLYVLNGYTHEHTPIIISLKKIAENLPRFTAQSKQKLIPHRFTIDFDLDLYGPTNGGGTTSAVRVKNLFFYGRYELHCK